MAHATPCSGIAMFIMDTSTANVLSTALHNIMDSRRWNTPQRLQVGFQGRQNGLLIYTVVWWRRVIRDASYSGWLVDQLLSCRPKESVVHMEVLCKVVCGHSALSFNKISLTPSVCVCLCESPPLAKAFSSTLSVDCSITSLIHWHVFLITLTQEGEWSRRYLLFIRLLPFWKFLFSEFFCKWYWDTQWTIHVECVSPPNLKGLRFKKQIKIQNTSHFDDVNRP